MDEELLKLEAELKRLRPIAPSLATTARIERELARPLRRTAPAPIRWLGWAALPAAAALVFVWFRWAAPRPAAGGAVVPVAASSEPVTTAEPAADVALKPVGAENLLVSARDEGVVTLADGTMARRERLQYVDTITWRNPRTRASLQWSVPREEVRIVPVTFQ